MKEKSEILTRLIELVSALQNEVDFLSEKLSENGPGLPKKIEAKRRHAEALIKKCFFTKEVKNASTKTV